MAWSSVLVNIKGAEGDPGTPANNGAPGETWFTGAADPTTVADSIVGDLYLNTVSGDVFRKTA